MSFRRNMMLLAAFMLLLVQVASAQNSKSFGTFDAELVKSGVIQVDGSASDVDLRLYVPQESLYNIEVTPNDWSFVEDKYGNKMINIHWDKLSVNAQYSMKIRVKNDAKFFSSLKPEKWAFEEQALEETNLTKASDSIRALAFGHETALEKAARLSIWIDENMNYEDKELRKETKSAIETYESRTGVCGEFSNLLAAALRSQGIPVRYVVGYAYSPKAEFRREIEEGDGFQAHAWVEVLSGEGQNKKWVPFDPTWLEAGYLDATHIRFAYLMDSEYLEEISYRSDGEVKWGKVPTTLRIFNYTTFEPLTLELKMDDELSANEYNLAEAALSGDCQLARIDLQPCVDTRKNSMFDVLDKSRRLWFCGVQRIFWIFKTSDQTNYKCSVIAYDQSAMSDEQETTVRGSSDDEDNYIIDGPDQLSAGDSGTFTSPESGIMFSPNFTEYSESGRLSLKFDKPGSYKLYFYKNNRIGLKEIAVSDRRDFELTVERPANVTDGDAFQLNVSVKNIGPDALPATIKVRFSNQSFSKEETFQPGEEKSFKTAFVADREGEQVLVVSVESRTIASYSTGIRVLENKSFMNQAAKTAKKAANQTYDFLSEMIGAITKFISNLFS